MRKFYEEIGLRKTEDRYYICLCSNLDGERSFLPVRGEEVSIEDFPEHDFFVFAFEDGNATEDENATPITWRVSDAITGLLIAEGDTKESAILLTKKKLLTKGKAGHEAMIVEKVYIEGVLSPRYTKEAYNKGRCVRCGVEGVARTHAGYCYPCAYIDSYKRFFQALRERRNVR